MSKFIGVKMVEAVPMTAGEAAKKGYRTPVAESAMDLYIAGYEVTYPDGYKSWCPKDVFEKNNVLIQGLCGKMLLKPNEEVEPFIQRVIDEYNELNVKYIKLSAFIDSDKMNELDKEDQDDLVIQANIMIAGISILNKRISRLLKKYPVRDVKDIKDAFTLNTPYLQVKIIPGTKCDFATASKYNIAGAYKNYNFDDDEPGTIILNESGTFWIPDFQSWATLKELEKSDNKEYIVGFTIKNFDLKENSGIINVEFNRIDISHFDKKECIEENVKNVIDNAINNVLK